jgi:hypothetical protein
MPGQPFVNEYFTYQDATRLASRMVRVRALVDFSGVDAGTLGQVVGWYEHPGKKYGVNIQWDLPGRAHPLIDGFSKAEYVRFLEEVG